jgi:16S rRNA (guanine(1405)-N(7))-methyltransferase
VRHDELNTLVEEIRASRKYRQMDIHPETVRDVVRRELAVHRSPKEAIKAARQKLHNIIAPYLGDPDYPEAARALEMAFRQGEPPGETAAQASSQAVRQVCSQIMASHASTRERLPLLDTFYQRLFAFTGRPSAILDLACGLNPFSFPWMGLPNETRYYAYDIHGPRVDLINHFFRLQGMEPLAAAQDVLVHPPAQEAEVGFFFKEAHRFEQRQKGANRQFWQALRVRLLLVSLPSASLSGRHNLADRQRALVRSIVGDLPWKVHEIAFENELVFCIEKTGEAGS